MIFVLMAEQAKNCEVAQRINRATIANPASPLAGKYLGILHGKIIAVADKASDIQVHFAAIGWRANDAIWMEASADSEHNYRTWRHRSE